MPSQTMSVPIATFTIDVTANSPTLVIDHTFTGSRPGATRYERVPGHGGMIEVTIKVPDDTDIVTLTRRVGMALEDLGMWGP